MKGLQNRLQIAGAHLGCAAESGAIVRACALAADDVCGSVAPDLTPDERLAALADRLSIEFSVARTTEELDRLVHEHARRGDLGFLARRATFDSDVIASVLHRRNPGAGERRFAALIDARNQKAFMEFFSKAHEMAHPMLEPQLEWEFRDERTKRDEWERLVDQAGAAMVFRGVPWSDALSGIPWTRRGGEITEFERIGSALGSEASVTALVLASANTIDHAVLVIWAELGTSMSDKTPTLRVAYVAPNTTAAQRALVHVPIKFRVPASSPIATAHQRLVPASGFEDTGAWTDSRGNRLPARRVWTAAEPKQRGVFAVMDFGPTQGW